MFFLQEKVSSLTLIQTIFPLISFVVGIAVTILQLYVTNRVSKIKEDVLNQVRAELKEAEERIRIMIAKQDLEIKENIQDIRRNMVTKDMASLMIQAGNRRNNDSA